VEYLHTDALGSVVAVSNNSGVVIERREYEPYGQQLTPVVQNGPGYTGHVQDAATGLTYMQQRYYDPGVGRFLSVDPVTALEFPQLHFNGYSYAYSNPYKFKDADGRCPICIPVIIFILKEAASEAVEQTTGIPMPTVKNATKAVARQAVRQARRDTLRSNAREGARRQREVSDRLRSGNPNARVQNEQYLRNSNGDIVRDSSGSGRRVDHAVIENGRAKTYETTSETASKADQIAKESEIRDLGGTYIRDRDTKELVPVEKISEVVRVK
jgi:RHS repeat-associated protein